MTASGRSGLLDTLDHLHHLRDGIYRILARSPETQAILDRVLEAVHLVFHDAVASDVRLQDARSNELRFVAFGGGVWPSETADRERRFGLDPGASVAARVYAAGEPIVVDMRLDQFDIPVPAGTKRVLVVPILAGPSCFGVIDLYCSSPKPLAPEAVMLATLLGKELGLYLDLAGAIRSVNELRNRFEQYRVQQAQTFRDLQHQFRSPLIVAHATIQRLIEGTNDYELRRQLMPIRSQIARGERVSHSTKLFADLAAGKTVVPEITSLPTARLVQRLREAAFDHEMIFRPEKNLRFSVNVKSFPTTVVDLRVDVELLDHAIQNLLDIAGKYSFEGTTVTIRGGFTRGDRFFISVLNTGLRIRPDEVFRCLERGVQGEEAIMSTGVGSGIGLWIVDQIMRAHDGEVVITPTTRDNLTEIRLLLPRTAVGVARA